MVEITAAAVKALRARTGLPMMDCKKALITCNGDEDAAIEELRKQGKALIGKRSDRETSFGRMGIHADMDKGVGAMVELKCESAPVTANEDFINLANELAEVLADHPEVTTAEELLAQPSPSHPGQTLGDVKDDMFNRIREVFNVGRLIRLGGPCGAYSHNAGTVSGVLLQVEEGDPTLAKDICMHIAAMRPKSLTIEELDPALVEKEREILTEAARSEGKPENIIEKMVEGRLRNFFAESVLCEQPFVKDDKLTVGKFAEQNGMKLVKFVHWELGQE